MKLLLDTYAFLWSITGVKLSPVAEEAFLNTDNDLYLSAASYWEICIKSSLGKLKLEDEWPRIFDREMLANGIKWLRIEKEHCRVLLELEFLHRDPFFRMLIAQARHENMTLLTAAQDIQQYPVPTLW